MKYLIYVIIGVLAFLLLRKIIRKLFSRSNKAIDLISGIIAISLTPLIAKGIFILFFNLILYEHHPERDFTERSWQDNIQDRHEMANDLLQSELLLNKSKTEIAEKIGLPNDKIKLELDTLSNWKYHMGSRGWGFGWKFYTLQIDFKNGESVEIRIKEVID